jgi:glycosyltransferase involved in cell wall biosynthesis
MGTGDFKVAFFVNGQDQHGLVRVSRFLAEGLSHLDGCAVTVVRSPDPSPPVGDAVAFYAPFQDVDVVVIHASTLTTDLWGPHAGRADAIAAFCSAVRPPVVAYLHDVYGETRFRSLMSSVARCVESAADLGRLRRHGVDLARQIIGHAQPAEATFVRRVAPCLAGCLVSNDVEQERLRRHRQRTPVDVIPLLMEERASLISKADAKARIGLADRFVVTLLGFIHHRKGHDIALSILERLPPTAVLVFAGTTVDENGSFFQNLRGRVRAMGAEDRVRITGYLSDDILDVHLSATDVAICPFREVAASSSLATWLAAGKPVVATDLPLFRMYRREFGEGIQLAPNGDAAAFARLVANVNPSAALEGRIRTAAQRYSVENTARRMLSSLKRMVKTGDR